MSALRKVLSSRGLVPEDDLRALEEWPAYRGAGLAERVYRSGLLSDHQLVEAFITLGAVDGTADLLRAAPPPAALGALSRALAERHRALPIRVERSRLVLAMLDPSDTHAIEKITFFCGLAVEPRAVRPRVLFQSLAECYAVPPVLPDAGFLSRSRGPAPPSSGSMTGENALSDFLPAPSPELQRSPTRPMRRLNIPRPAVTAPTADPAPAQPTSAPAPPAHGAPSPSDRTGDPSRSPLARGLAAAAGEEPQETAETVLSSLGIKDMRPSSSPPVSMAALEQLRRALPSLTALEARDSLPPQVLKLLVPPLRNAVLFLVRGKVAVGWDAHGAQVRRDTVRDVLLPLTAPSVLERAFQWRRVAVGHPGDPSTTERLLFRALGGSHPVSCAVVPINVGDQVTALLYLDTDTELIDDPVVDAARRVGNTLADGLAPFVAAGTLFPDVTKRKLLPISA